MIEEHKKTSTPINNILCEFFEVAIHSILYVRKQYPETIFERKRKYGVIVFQSVHPDVNDYIIECLKAINFHLKKKQLRNIFLCFHSAGNIIEKYDFQVLNINCFLESDPFLVKPEEYMREFCLKLNSSTTSLNSLPVDSIFSIQLNVTEYSTLEFSQQPSNEGFPWISLTNNESIFSSSEILPLYTIQTDFLNLQMYIEKISN